LLLPNHWFGNMRLAKPHIESYGQALLCESSATLPAQAGFVPVSTTGWTQSHFAVQAAAAMLHLAMLSMPWVMRHVRCAAVGPPHRLCQQLTQLLNPVTNQETTHVENLKCLLW
jgi:hypothetical protein